MRKSGGRFDLGVALGILIASHQVVMKSPIDDDESTAHDSLGNVEFFGELALSGELRCVPGILPAALRAAEENRALVVPAGNAREAALANPSVRAAHSLREVTAHIGGGGWTCRDCPGRPARGGTAATGSLRCARPDACPARAGDCGSRRAQPVVQRASRNGEEHAGPQASGHPAGYVARRGAGNRRGRFRARHCVRFTELSPAAFSRAAPFGVGRGTGRRRFESPPRRDITRADVITTQQKARTFWSLFSLLNLNRFFSAAISIRPQSSCKYF